MYLDAKNIRDLHPQYESMPTAFQVQLVRTTTSGPEKAFLCAYSFLSMYVVPKRECACEYVCVRLYLCVRCHESVGVREHVRMNTHYISSSPQ